MFEADVDDPMALISGDQQRAREAGDPTAELCVLSTVDGRGNPQARTLILRAVSEHSLLVFVSASSRKWAQLPERNCHLQMHWPSIGRQYRVGGPWREMDASELYTHWNQRPWASKVLDWFYEETPQGSEVASRAVLQEAVSKTEAQLLQRHGEQAHVPMPPGARGLWIVAHTVEAFSLDDATRLHDSHLYRRGATGEWARTLRVP